MRDLSRKVKKEAEALSACRFQVDTDAFAGAVSRVSAFMNIAGIDPERQLTLITATAGGDVILESGSSGSYCRVTISAQVAVAGYFTMPTLTLRQLRWGNPTTIFTTLVDEKQVEYRSKIRGRLAVPHSPDPVTRNRPQEDKSKFTTFPKDDFIRVLTASYFRAETMDENHGDVLVRIDITGEKSEGHSHKLSVSVHDGYRAAYSQGGCTADGPSTSVLQGSLLWQFLKGCTRAETTFDMSIADGAVYFRTPSTFCTSPLVHGDVRDVEKWAGSFIQDEADFNFVVDTEELWSAVVEVSSVQDRDPNVEKRLRIKSKGKKGLVLEVEGELGSAQRKVETKEGTEGQVDVDFTFMLDSLSIFKKDNQPVLVTVWEGAVRMDMKGNVKSTHFMSVLEASR